MAAEDKNRTLLLLLERDILEVVADCNEAAALLDEVNICCNISLSVGVLCRGRSRGWKIQIRIPFSTCRYLLGVRRGRITWVV